jgi:hypothetical protein
MNTTGRLTAALALGGALLPAFAGAAAAQGPLPAKDRKAMMRPSTRPAILHRAACALVVAAVFLVAGASLGVALALAARSSESVLVDANADGDTPISGGLIHVYRCARPASRRGVVAGASLRQSNGARSERTNSAGVALLGFERLPSCFIVNVAGGRANGRTGARLIAHRGAQSE